MKLPEYDRQRAWQIARDVYAENPNASRRELRRKVRSKAYGAGMSTFLVHLIVPIIIKLLQGWMDKDEDPQAVASMPPDDFADDLPREYSEMSAADVGEDD